MHFNMEGTKHEKVVLVVLSYIIGFTAGFICFYFAAAVPENEEVAIVPAIPMSNQSISAAIAEMTSVQNEAETPEATDGEVIATYQDGNLKVNVGETSLLLSMKMNTLTAAEADAFADQGINTDIPAYSVSPDKKFVYYCEQKSTTDLCTPYLFNASTTKIYQLTVLATNQTDPESAPEPEKMLLTAAEAKAVVWKEGKLSTENAVSISTEEPWNLLSN